MKFFRNLIGLCVMLFLSISPLHAQKETFKNELYLGVGAGPLFSKVDFVPGVPETYKQGILGGISAKYISENHLGLIVELNYVQRGWEQVFESSPDFSYSRTLNYMDIPFLCHVYFGGKTRFLFNIGPQLSFLIGHNEKMSQALSDDVDKRRAENPEVGIGMQYGDAYELKSVDYGLVGGIGMEFKTPVGDFDLEGRYYFGLGDIFTNRRSEEAFFSRSASRVIEAKLTYYIRVF